MISSVELRKSQFLVPLGVFITTWLEWQIWVNTEISEQDSITHIVGNQQKYARVHS